VPVVLVGAGPGDPGLLTLRGQRALAEAQVVVFDAEVAEGCLEAVPDSAERVPVGDAPPTGSSSTIARSSSNLAARHTTSPSGEITNDPPSNTNSSWPPTSLTYTIHALVSAARARSTSARACTLPRS